MCCSSLEIQDTKIVQKNRHLHTITQLCRTVSLQPRHVSTIGKKHVKRQYVLHTFSQYGKLRPTNGLDLLASLGHPSNFNGFRVLPSLLQRHHSPDANQTLHDIWPSAGLVHYIYIFGAVAPSQNFALCKIHFTSRFCIRLYWLRYCMALQQQASAKLCGVVQGMELRTFSEGAIYIWQGGHHVGHRPPF